MRSVATLVALFFCCSLVAASGARGDAVRQLTFNGGPAGGVYTEFASGIKQLLAKEMPELQVTVRPSAGSVSNLNRIASGRLDMAIAAASDIDTWQPGRVKPKTAPLTNVMAIARLYGEYAHLAVLEQSPYKTPADLALKRIAVGSRGSGTLTAARGFFEGLGLWKKISPDYSSYDLASRDFLTGQVQAVWQLVGYPSSSLQELSRKVPIRLIPLGGEAEESGLYATNRRYLPGTIPAETYRGVGYEVPTFMTPAIWVVSKELDPEIVYRALQIVFSPEGLEHLRSIHPVARQLDATTAGRDLPLPLHPGARRFWAERQ